MAERKNTGNPIPSNAIDDLNDNTIIIDEFVNSEQDYTTNRFGIEMPTFQKLIEDWSARDEMPAAPIDTQYVAQGREWLQLADYVPKQIQSDWEQADEGQVDFIKNKPIIPEPQINADWNSNNGVSEILNKPVIPEPQVNADWNAMSGVEQILNKPDIPTDIMPQAPTDDFYVGQGKTWSKLSDHTDRQEQVNWTETDETKVSFIQNKPIIPDPQIQSDWDQEDSAQLDFIKNKPSGLMPQVQSDWTQIDDTKVDFIRNKPTIPETQIQSDWKQSDNTKLDFIKNKPMGLVPQIQSDWTQTDNTKVDFIKNKPVIPNAQINSDWKATRGVAQILNKPEIPEAQINADWTAVGTVAEILNKPTIPQAQIQTNYDQQDTTALDYLKGREKIISTNDFHIDESGMLLPNGLEIKFGVQEYFSPGGNGMQVDFKKAFKTNISIVIVSGTDGKAYSASSWTLNGFNCKTVDKTSTGEFTWAAFGR